MVSAPKGIGAAISAATRHLEADQSGASTVEWLALGGLVSVLLGTLMMVTTMDDLGKVWAGAGAAVLSGTTPCGLLLILVIVVLVVLGVASYVFKNSPWDRDVPGTEEPPTSPGTTRDRE